MHELHLHDRAALLEAPRLGARLVVGDVVGELLPVAGLSVLFGEAVDHLRFVAVPAAVQEDVQVPIADHVAIATTYQAAPDREPTVVNPQRRHPDVWVGGCLSRRGGVVDAQHVFVQIRLDLMLASLPILDQLAQLVLR
eukprot:7887434-Pyramimonas_sp.AAC.1